MRSSDFCALLSDRLSLLTTCGKQHLYKPIAPTSWRATPRRLVEPTGYDSCGILIVRSAIRMQRLVWDRATPLLFLLFASFTTPNRAQLEIRLQSRC